MTLAARVGRDGARILCGLKQCGGELGTRLRVPVLGPFGVPTNDWDSSIDLPSIFVRHDDAEGVIWEEPKSRRRRRMQGLRSEHHGLTTRETLESPVEYLPRAILRAADLPARVRCPKCGVISEMSVALLL
jgi:hypothetical protein